MRPRNVWEECAASMIREHGFLEAKRIAVQQRDSNSPGTASFAFHNAVVKAFGLLASIGRIEE